jgi:hypothetical protein
MSRDVPIQRQQPGQSSAPGLASSANSSDLASHVRTERHEHWYRRLDRHMIAS